MDSLLALKALTKNMRKEITDVVGDKKFYTKTQLEQARIKRIRDEEEVERSAKVSIHAVVQVADSLLEALTAASLHSHPPHAQFVNRVSWQYLLRLRAYPCTDTEPAQPEQYVSRPYCGAGE